MNIQRYSGKYGDLLTFQGDGHLTVENRESAPWVLVNETNTGFTLATDDQQVFLKRILLIPAEISCRSRYH